MARRDLYLGCKSLYPRCAPARKPSSFHSVKQHQFFAFHSTIFHTNRGNFLVLMVPDGRILKANFPAVTPRTLFARGSYRTPHPCMRGQAPYCCDPGHRAHSKIMRPYLCPSKNKLLAPPLYSELRLCTCDKRPVDLDCK